MNKKHIHSKGLVKVLSPIRHFYKFVLKGEKVRCNVCGETYKRFRAFGVNKRENSLCPNCYSLESTRILWFYITNEVIGRKNKKKFLYFSPEISLLEKLQNYKINLKTVGFSYLNQLNKLPHDQKLKGGKYDVILFSHLLQYTIDETMVFEEIKRLLRQGGFALIVTIINWEMERTYENITSEEDKDRLKEFYEPGVKRVYGSDFYKHLIKAGFEVEVVDYAEQLGNSARTYYQLGNGVREMIFKCKKL